MKINEKYPTFLPIKYLSYIQNILELKVSVKTDNDGLN